MATVGHFITMLGVFFFYAGLFEAHVEKKLTVYFYTIIARFNSTIFCELHKGVGI